MRIAIVCNDTRGGVQPYAALGIGLREAGHDVRVIAPQDFAPMFTQLGLPIAPLSGSTEEALRNSNGATGRGTFASMRFMAQELPKRLGIWTRETLAACQGVDVLTGGVGRMVVGEAVAEKLRVPFVQTHLQPIGAPASDYPGALLSGMPRWLGPWGMRLSHSLSEQAIWMPFRPAMAKVREKVLGLHGPPAPELEAASIVRLQPARGPGSGC